MEFRAQRHITGQNKTK